MPAIHATHWEGHFSRHLRIGTLARIMHERRRVFDNTLK